MRVGDGAGAIGVAVGTPVASGPLASGCTRVAFLAAVAVGSRGAALLGACVAVLLGAAVAILFCTFVPVALGCAVAFLPFSLVAVLLGNRVAVPFAILVADGAKVFLPVPVAVFTDLGASGVLVAVARPAGVCVAVAVAAAALLADTYRAPAAKSTASARLAGLFKQPGKKCLNSPA